MKKIALLLFLVSPLLSFSQEKYTTKTDIYYYETKSKDAYQNERCVLDIYYPENKKDFATIIWFHGGGITGGNKELPEALKNKG